MKKILTFLMLTCCYALCEAQIFSLTIDNQNPGWLSSKIEYGDQQTLKNLTVMGYINREDFRFIGTLIQSHNLNGTLDLSNCQYIDEYGVISNEIPEYIFKSSGEGKTLTKLIMPTSIIKYQSSWAYPLQIDSLVIGGMGLKSITKNVIPNVKNLFIREGAELLGAEIFASNSTIVSVSLPSTLKEIGPSAFSNSSILSTNLPDSVEKIGSYAFQSSTCLGDDIRLPKSLKQLYTNIFYNSMPKKLYIGPNVTYINNEAYQNNSNMSIYGEKIDMYVFSQEPPNLIYGDVTAFKNVNIYVTEETLETYKASAKWGKLNLIGFSIPNQIKHLLPDYMYVGEQYKISKNEDQVIPIIWDNNSDIIEISNDNLFCAKSGEASISGHYLYQDISTTFTIPVFHHTTGVQLEQRELEVMAGQTFTVAAKTLPDGTSDGRIRWSSEDESIVSVSSDGTAIAHQSGLVYLTATSEDGGYTKECRVTVKSNNTGIKAIYENNDAFVRIYNLYGLPIYEGKYSNARLKKGLYIVLCNGEGYKIKVE